VLRAHSRIGPYEIQTLIGAGGMGEVYRARDTKLQRDVAIKILPDAFIGDPERLARFEREARTLASLNHPHIGAIYGLEEADGLRAIVLELVEGETLAEKRGASIAESLSIARQIAEALTAAHARGIIHRDLKPANVKVTPDGIVKVLDFGLAKAVAGTGAPLDVAESPTLTTAGTRLGAIVGTAAYMSPEQAHGKQVDKRTDIWAFGCVLYELLAGRAPFARESITGTLAAIIERDPEWTALPNATPPAIVGLLRRCLEKDPARRLHDMADVRIAIEDVDSNAGWSTSRPSTRGTRSGPLRWVATAATVLVATVGIGGWWMLTRAHALTEKDTIVLADFTNTTQDAVFDDTLRRGLSVQLEQSPFLSIVSEDQIQQTLRLMGEKPDVKLTGPVSRQICRRTASAAVVDGSISQIGTQYELILKAVNCASGGSLASTDARAADKNHVLDALGTAAANLRNKLGESLSTVRQFNVPLEQATTPSLEALQAFSSAVKVLYGPGGSPAAIPFFKRATELDPNFAAAYAMLGRMFIDVGESSGAVDATRKAYELRDRASEREKYAISAAYELLVTGNLQRADEICAVWMQAYPRAVEPRNLSSGPVNLQLGRYEKTLDQAEEAIRSHPDLPIAYMHLMLAFTALDRMDEAKAARRRAMERHIDSPFLDLAEYPLDFLEGDTAGMAKVTARAGAKPGIDAVMLANEALTAAFAGRLAKARELSRQAAASAERAEHKEELAGYLVSDALVEALFGNVAEARRGRSTSRTAATTSTERRWRSRWPAIRAGPNGSSMSYRSVFRKTRWPGLRTCRRFEPSWRSHGMTPKPPSNNCWQPRRTSSPRLVRSCSSS
jgi:serine/threonine protein kinase/tetratricopeptide (TPR) repeat protein